MMKCHYEMLGVPQDAEESEIKTAYKKLALKWHPDKNLDNLEEAKEQFLLIQQAYEVLSDPFERAWYDNHREQILRGKNSKYEDNSLDLFQYFTASCFKGYNDESGGFYMVYADVFEKIIAEDAEFMDDEEDIMEIPKFGDSQSTYEEIVGPFYAYWQSYCTKKSYSWLCPYDLTEIKDRRVLREIEKETKKIVQKAKRERNEEVRNLVSFVRKRDKRVQAYKKMLEEKAALNRQKQERIRLEQIQKRKKEIEELQKCKRTTLNDSYEEQLRLLEAEYSGSEKESDISEEEDGCSGDKETDVGANETLNEVDFDGLVLSNSLYCIACNRTFRNENAFLNHESSKKHKANIELLKTEMVKDECSYETTKRLEEVAEILNNEIKENDLTNGSIEEAHLVKEESPVKQKQNKKKKKSRLQKQIDSIDSDEDESKNKSDIDFVLQKSDSDESESWTSNKKGGKKSKGSKANEKRKPVNSSKTDKNRENNVTAEDLSESEEQYSPYCINSKENSIFIDTTHTCATCMITFTSKNKLFTHLKRTNHGVYIPKMKNTTKGKKGKRGN